MNDWHLEQFGLPAADIAAEVNAHLSHCPTLVVTAPPGAGKSTLLPLTMLSGLCGEGGKVLLLEPRRIAARQIATRMAEMIGEEVGQTVGYRIRRESRVSDSTRLEVVTEGILTRMIIDDPTLDGIDIVVFDEFHERNIHSDVALVLAREAQQLLRPDLKIVVMSATIDATTLCQHLQAPLVESAGRMFDVSMIRGDEEADALNCAEVVARTIIKAHAQHDGDILAFLPGQAEIMRCRQLLGDALGPTAVCPLFGQMTPAEQQRAIAPSRQGERKVVLATNIAETSLTIEGVRVVIDSGLCRTLVVDQRNALSHLVTTRISIDMATQRMGRAGRVTEGICYRLWTLATEHRMAESRSPEIVGADLTSMLLDIAAWQGSANVDTVLAMQWLTPPSAAKIAQARQLLQMLHALDADGKLTPHGRKLAALPYHPRIAQMFVAASDKADLMHAEQLAAAIEDKDPLASRCSAGSTPPADLRLRLKDGGQGGRISVGAMVAMAYPERIAMLQKDGSYMLAEGIKARLPEGDALEGYEYLAVASVNAQGNGRIFLAAPLAVDDVKHLAIEYNNVQWDSRQGRILAQRELRIGRLTLNTQPLHNIPREQITDIICCAARKDGLSMFDFNDAVQALQQRVATLASWHPELELPDLSTQSVLDNAHCWLPLYIGKASNVAELRHIDLAEALLSMLSYEQQQQLEQLAPTHLVVPTGSRIRLEYRQGTDLPVLRVRLQECFGLTDTPTVDGGKRPVLMELLSPGFKPVQLTQDLASFWSGTYFEVRKELRRRYPKHSWPDNPLEAPPTRRTKTSQ